MLCFRYTLFHDLPMVYIPEGHSDIRKLKQYQSQPIHGFWDKTIPSHCVSGDDILVVPGAINAVLDGLVILLVSDIQKALACMG